LVGGVQVGYNWHYSPKIVYGVEADISLADGDVDWLASIRGRVGYLVDPRLLAYVTAGFGFANDHHGTESDFVLGLGVEGRINDNTTVRLEYLNYNDLEQRRARRHQRCSAGRQAAPALRRGKPGSTPARAAAQCFSNRPSMIARAAKALLRCRAARDDRLGRCRRAGWASAA
jgi:hypothetical protein